VKFRKQRLRLVGIILSGLVFVLAGCGTISTHPSKARKLTYDATIKLSLGDTRQEVRSLLGEPLIDAKGHRLEVYRFTGRDTNIDLTPFPLPLPSSEKLTTAAIFIYDEENKIKNMAVDAMTESISDVEDYMFQSGSFRISAGGYRFVTPRHLVSPKPETLIGPPISWEELTKKAVSDEECSLVLLNRGCPMEMVSVDNKQIVNLSPAGAECGRAPAEFLGTYIQKNISPGMHRLVVTQKTSVQDRDFKADFECDSGETIYAELDVDVNYKSTYVFGVKWGSKKIIDGELSVSNSPPQKNITSKSGLSPILWHKGEWYGPTSPNGSVSQ
jgi:outer membrane protein assembly factor BamE (lipoprotein component of BamABCDE complex)